MPNSSQQDFPDLLADELEEYKYASRMELIASLEEARRQIESLEIQNKENQDQLSTLIASEKKYRLLLDQSSDPIFSFGPRGRYRYVNHAFAELVNMEFDHIVGKTVWHVFPKKEADKRYQMIREVFETGKEIVEEELIPTPEKELFYLTTAKPIFDENHRVSMAICISKDITERKKLEKDLEKSSTHDQLTGLFNRYHLEAELGRFQGGRSFPFGIVVADMDDLKYVNDRYGHSAGDILLRKIARILQETFRKDDIIARSGGDEFVILLPSTPVLMVEKVVARLRNNLKSQENLLMKLSVGFAVGIEGCNLTDVLKEADDEMYKDKSARKKKR